METDLITPPQRRRHDARPAQGPASVDLGVVTDSVMRSFSDVVSRERVECLLSELLEQEFSTARVTAFLPIFLHRVACETLRRELDAQRPPLATPGPRGQMAQQR